MKLNTFTPKRRIHIPTTDQHCGHDAITIETEWKCLVCGGKRGIPFKAASYDGSLRLDGVDSWKTHAVIKNCILMCVPMNCIKAICA